MNSELGAHAIIHFYPPTTWSASALSHVWEVTTSIRRFGKSMLKNKYHENGSCADYFAQAVVFCSKWEVLSLLFWSCVCLQFSVHQHTQDSLIKRTLSADLGTDNEKQAVKQPYWSSSSMWKSLWLENFMTPGLMTIISTPQKQSTIQYVVAVYTAT